MSDNLLLSDEELEALTPEQLVEYQSLLEAAESVWTLNPKQEEAEALAHTVDELMYGGSAGGGKTEWLLWHAYQLSTKHKRHKTLALRRTFPQLKDSLIRRSIEKFTDKKVCRYLVGEKEWQFYDTGSTIRFGFCDTDDDVRHYLSTEYDLIIFEELTEFSERMYTLIRSRCRTTAMKRAQGIRPHSIAATNPGQVGHAWVKKRFVTSTDHGQHPATQILEAFGRKKEMTVAFVPAKVADNPKIDPDYVFALMQLPEIERRQYLDGDWDVFEGQFFTEFSRERHVVEPFDIPESWPRIRAIDYGWAKPFCCLWIAFDYDGNAIVYRELYATHLTASMQAKLILERSVFVDEHGHAFPEKIKMTVADPSIWNRQGDGRSIEGQYRDEGLICKRAKNARRDGWSRVRDYLSGELTDHPKLVIFSTNENLIRTLPDMIHDKNDPEDLDTHLEDHAEDTLRYGLMTQPRRAKKPPPQNDPHARLSAKLDELVREGRNNNHPILGRL